MDPANIDEVRDSAFLGFELRRSNMRSSLPYIVRFRQCVVEYTSPSNDSRRPLLNALKYASSFPVIYLSAAQRLVVSDLVAEKGEQAMEEAWHGEHALFRLWYVWSVFLLFLLRSFLIHAVLVELSGYFSPSLTLYIPSGGT
jgi:hypothetical protein